MAISIKERLQRMEIYQADKKHRLIREEIREPKIEFGSFEEIDSRFKDYCEKQTISIFQSDHKPQESIAHPQLTQERKLLPSQQRSKQSTSTYFRPQTLQFAASPSPVSRSAFFANSTKANSTTNTKSALSNNHSALDSYKISKSTVQQQTNRQRLTTISSTTPLNPQTSSRPTRTADNKQKQRILKPNQFETSSQIYATTSLNTLKTHQANSLSVRFASPPPPAPPSQQIPTNTRPAYQQNRRLTVGMDILKLMDPSVRLGAHKSETSARRQTLKTQDSQNIGIDQRVTQSAEWQTIQKKLKESFKINRTGDNPDTFVNPLVKLFGNNFIAMVMQALVVKKIDDLYGVKFTTDSKIPISENILREFGISTATLNQLSNPSERNKYIAETMSLRITMMLREWEDKQQQRFARIEEANTLDNREKNRIEEMNSDLFDWLKIGTNHEMLKKKLKMTIIEQLTDFDNQGEISAKVKAQSSHERDSISKSIQLKNIPTISTKILLLRVNEDSNRYLKEDLTEEQKKQYEDFQNFSGKGSANPANKNDESGGTNSSDHLAEWDEKLEREFLNNKKLAKIIYSQDINVSSWNKQGYLPLVQEYNLSNKKKLERDHLVAQYQNGCWLTEKELKFIADTSTLLNKCIDKTHVQNIVNIIRKDDISQLELNLAEMIISNYENMQQVIREKRRDFLEERSRQAGLFRQKVRFQEEVRNTKVTEFKKNVRKVKMFRTIGKHLLSQRTAFKIDTFRNNFYCQMFFEKMCIVLAQIRKRAQNRMDEYMHIRREENTETVGGTTSEAEPQVFYESKQPLKNTFLDKITQAKGSKDKLVFYKSHELHPPSKLPCFAQSDDPVSQNRINSITTMVNRFHLSTRSKPMIRIEENFSKFYSGGPAREKSQTTASFISKIQEKSLNLTKAQIAGIVRIQTMYRERKMRRIIKELKEQHHQEKYKVYIENLWGYISRKRFPKVNSKSKENQKVSLQANSHNEKDSNILSESYYSSSDEERNYKVSELHPSAAPKKKLQPTRNSESFLTPSKSDYSQSTSKLSQVKQNINNPDRNPSSPNHHTNLYSANNTSKTDTKLFDTLSSQESTHHVKTTEDLREPIEIYDLHYLEQTRNEETASSQEYLTMNPESMISSQQITKTPQTKPQKQWTLESAQKCLNQKAKKLTPGAIMKQKKLLNAAKNNHFVQIMSSGFAFSDTDVNVQDNLFNTPLYYAIKNSNVNFVRWLIARNALINQECEQKNTPVHQAFKQNNQEILADIICLNPDLNALNDEGMTPLAYAPLETLNKLNLQHAIIYKSDSQTHPQSTEQMNNNSLLFKQKDKLKSIGKVKLNSFYPIKSPTILHQEYLSL